MKQFKRVSALLMAVALIFGLLPSGLLPTKATATEGTTVENYVHASYSEETITVDGTMNLTDEPAYRRTISLPAGKLSVAWDKGNLYVAAEAAITALAINGVEVALTAGAKEVKIPFADVSILDLTKTYAFSVKIGTMETAWNAKLIFDANVYARLGTHNNIAYGATTLESNWKFELDSLRNQGVNETTANQLKYDMYYPKQLSDKTPLDFAVSTDAPTVVEMDVEVKYLPSLEEAPKTYADWITRNVVGALAFTIRDNSGTANAGDALVTAVYRIGTDLYLMYPDNANETVHSVKIGTYSEDYAATETYHLRMEYSYRLVEDVTVADVVYYVNGAKVAEQADVYKNSTTSTGWSAVGPIIQMVAHGVTNENEEYYAEGRVEAIVENLSVTHEDAVLAEYVADAASSAPLFYAAFYGEETEYKRWSMPLSADLNIRAEWDWNNLYLSFIDDTVVEEGEPEAQAVELPAVKVAGKTFTPGTEELVIPWTDILDGGINAALVQAAPSITLSVGDFLGFLVLDTNVVESGIGKEFFRFNDTTITETHGFASKTTETFGQTNALVANAETDTVVSFELDIVSLTNGAIASGQRHLVNGYNILIKDDLNNSNAKAFTIAFCQIGDVRYLVHSYTNAESAATYKQVDITAFGDQLFVRVEFDYTAVGEDGLTVDDPVAAKYYINGVLVSETDNARAATGAALTSAASRVEDLMVSKRGQVWLNHLSVAHMDNTILANRLACEAADHIDEDTDNVCDRCGYNIPAHVCDFSIQGEIIPATCMAAGSNTMECSCGLKQVTTLDIDPENHTGNNHVEGKLDATCGKPGYTGDTVCECGVTVDEGEEIKATGEHVYATEVEGTKVPATCMSEGSVTMACGCGATEVKTLAIDPENHTGNNHVEGKLDATCGKPGYTGDTVCECGVTVDEGEEIKATGEHVYATEVEGTKVPATCMSEGSVTMACGCGATEVKTLAIDPENHTGNNHVEGKLDATCGKPGYTGDTVCECGETVDEGEEIKATGEHVYATEVEGTKVPATCMSEGSVTMACSCGATEVKTLAIDPENHTFGQDGYCACGAEQEGFGFVAQVGNHKYATLEAAIEAANGETITLLENIVLEETWFIADDVVINLGGKEISGDVEGLNGLIYVKKGASLTVQGEGAITASATHAIGNYGTVTIEGGVITTAAGDEYAALYNFYYAGYGEGTAIITAGELNTVFNCGQLTVNGGKIAFLNTSSELTVNGGEIAQILAKDGSHANGAYEIAIADDSIITTEDDFKLVEVREGVYTVVAKNYVAQIGEKKYESLKDAIEAAEPEATITLLKSVSGSGIVINKSITIDFDGKTYTFISPAVGSSGTQSLGFQILKNNIVVLKNGTLEVAEAAKTDFAFLIQNYANLTISGMTLDGTYLDRFNGYNYSYVLSNNSGNVAIVDTTIIVNDDGDAYAFDACKFKNYAEPTVTVSGKSNIGGIIEVTGGNLVLNGGTFTGELVYDSGSVTKAEAVELAAPEGYCWNAAGILGAHIGGEAVEENRNESTCTVAGSYDEVVYCAHCGEKMSSETKELPLAKHTEVTVPGRDATCTATGLTAGVKCSVCDLPLVKQEEIPMVDHNYVDGVCGVCGDGDPNYPVINKQPAANKDYALGEKAEFTFDITGDGITYQWYFRVDSESEWLVSYDTGCTTATLSFEVQAYRVGRQYMCVIIDAYGNKIESEAVTVKLQAPSGVITKQPEDVECMVGDEISFTVEAEGSNLTYQWFISTDGWKTWKAVEGATSATWNFTAEQWAWYKCKVTDGSGSSVWSNAVKLQAKNAELAINSHPVANNSYALNKTVEFTVEAVGDGLIYQWYFRENENGEWMRCYDAGCQTATLSFTMQAYRDGREYMCEVKDAYGYTEESAAVTVKLQAPSAAFTDHPDSIGINRGENATFTVEAVGDGLAYQWYISTDGWKTWKVVSGATSESLTVENATESAWYKCRIKDGSGKIVWSDAALLWFYAVKA